jgi:hypothetical protein
MAKNPEFKKFEVPNKVLDKLYELTGSTGAYKGFVIAYATDTGDPVVQARFDNQMTEYALNKAMETYMLNLDTSTAEIDEEENT